MLLWTAQQYNFSIWPPCEHACEVLYSTIVNEKELLGGRYANVFSFSILPSCPLEGANVVSHQEFPCTLPNTWHQTLFVVKKYLLVLIFICIFMNIHEIEQIFMFNGSLISSSANYSCISFIQLLNTGLFIFFLLIGGIYHIF